MTTNIERLAKLMYGLERAHGVFQITGQKENGKYEGKAYTSKEPWTLENWVEHVNGEVGLGIVPIDDDGMCMWAAIDVDVYPLDIKALQALILSLGLPLVVLESKSGGAHLYLFMKERVPAVWIIEIMRKWAIALGYPTAEIFPKQKKLANKDDVGNWLNMPYFGNTRRMWKNKDLEYFLKWAESMKQTVEVCEAIQVEEDDEDPWTQAPPCLQIIATDGAPEGTRNKFMFNMGVYLKQVRGDANLEDHLHEANHKVLDEALPLHEISGIAKSLSGDKEYFYQCSEEPLCGNCDKPLCKTRKYGVGSSEGGFLNVEFNSLHKLATDPPIWYLDADGYRVEISTLHLFKFQAVKERCAEVLTKHIGSMKQGDWDIKVAELLANCEIIEMPEDSGTIGSFKGLLNEFITGGAIGDSRDDMLTGRPWFNDSDSRYYFRLLDFMAFLDNRKFREYSQAQIASKLKTLGATHGAFNIKGAYTRWWAIAPVYAKQDSEFDVQEQDLPMQGVK